jgi:hypothetical protein
VVSVEAVSKEYSGAMLDISDDVGKKDLHGREEIISVLQKTNKVHVQMVKTLSDTKFINYNNTYLETIQEEPLCLLDSQYSMLNDTERIYQQRSFDMNKDNKSDMPKSFHELGVLERSLYHVSAPAVPKLNYYGMDKEGIHSQKIRILWKKMNAVFDGILNLYGKIPEPDGSQDFLRRHKRAAEFCSRFSRNYLYPLQQQASILCNICKLYSMHRDWYHQMVIEICCRKDRIES